MKTKPCSLRRRLLTVLLAALLCQTSPNVRYAEAQIAGAVLIVACMAVSGCVIIRVMSKNAGYNIHRLVLQRSPTLDGQNWACICTNDFTLQDGQWFSAWGMRMQTGGLYHGEMYRIIEIPIPPGGFRSDQVHTNTVWLE